MLHLSQFDTKVRYRPQTIMESAMNYVQIKVFLR